MPRIDPQQLLSCLGVLLTPTGGILSKNEVQRLANLMTKFSKKLVSKCVYVLILKNTEIPLLGAFMVEGGWNLVHVWLQDGYNNRNWALVLELLELLLMSPTDVEQLKMNNLPKLVKSLSKRDDLEKIKKLANQLVMKWLKIVKDDQIEKTGQGVNVEQQNQKLVVNNSLTAPEPVQVVEVPVVQVEQENEDRNKSDPQNNNQKSDSSVSVNTQPCYKLAVRDGKHVLCKVPPSEANVTVVENAIIEDITPVDPLQDSAGNATVEEDTKAGKEPEKVPEEPKEKKEVDKKKEKSNHDRHKHKSSSSSSKSGSSSRSSRDKDRRSRDKSKEKSKSSSSSHERSRDKSKHDKDKHKNNGDLKSSSRSSSSSSSCKDKDKDKDKKETKEKQAEKDKDTLAKLQPPSLSKIGRIPKKSSEEKKDEKKEETKKPTFSIEVRKSSEEKPKTVKVFNAKMRSTGLLEEAKPPPPRTAKKQPPANLPPVLPQKRPSPIRDPIPPPEKKPKTEAVERPGAIKLIPPKPKRGGNTSGKLCGCSVILDKLK